MDFISKLRSGLRDPKKGVKYLILGEKNFNTLDSHYCFSVSPKSPLEHQMIQPTDIHEHLQTLYMLNIELNLKNVLELGTRTGESTIALLLATKELEGTMTSVDVDECHEAKSKVKKFSLEKYWNFIQSDDLTLNWETPIDHLFIDTSHEYDHTLAELKKFEPLVRKGGIITFHDITSSPPVLNAINDFIIDRKDFRFYKFFHNNGLGILRKI